MESLLSGKSNIKAQSEHARQRDECVQACVVNVLQYVVEKNMFCLCVCVCVCVSVCVFV